MKQVYKTGLLDFMVDKCGIQKNTLHMLLLAVFSLIPLLFSSHIYISSVARVFVLITLIAILLDKESWKNKSKLRRFAFLIAALGVLVATVFGFYYQFTYLQLINGLN